MTTSFVGGLQWARSLLAKIKHKVVQFSQFIRSFLRIGKRAKMSLEEYLLTLEERNRFRRPLTAWENENNQLAADRIVLANISKALDKLLKEKSMSRAHACKLVVSIKGIFTHF